MVWWLARVADASCAWHGITHVHTPSEMLVWVLIHATRATQAHCGLFGLRLMKGSAGGRLRGIIGLGGGRGADGPCVESQ